MNDWCIDWEINRCHWTIINFTSYELQWAACIKLRSLLWFFFNRKIYILQIGKPVLIISSAYLVSGHLVIGCLSIFMSSLFLGSSTLKPIDWLNVRGTLYLSSRLVFILVCLYMSWRILLYDLYSLALPAFLSSCSLILWRAAVNSSKETLPSWLASKSYMNMVTSSSSAG